MQKPVEPKKILCIHDLSGVGRCSLAVILPVLSVMGFQPVALPTVVLSTHTGGLGTPARMDGSAYGMAALEHYQTLGLQFDCIYTGYLGGEAQVALAEKAFALWPAAYKVVDPVMGDNGKAYSTVTPALVERIRSLCRAADLILPNYTEAQLLLQQQPVTDEPDLPLSASLVPIFLITALEILNSTLVWFCPKYAQLLLGKPVTIIRNGEILQDELAQLRITASDLAEALRGKDIFSPKDVYWGVIEPNGSITAAPMPQDSGEPPMLPLLIDKEVYKENLAFFGMDTEALDALLRREQTTREAVLLLLYNGKKSILIQKKAAPKGAA